MTAFYLHDLDQSAINFRGADISDKSYISRAIEQTGYDSALWDKYEFIKRTEEERRILKKQ